MLLTIQFYVVYKQFYGLGYHSTFVCVIIKKLLGKTTESDCDIFFSKEAFQKLEVFQRGPVMTFQTFHFYMMANYSIYRKLLMRKLADTGLTPGQPKILDYLSEHDGASQHEIAAANMIEPASLTTLLNGMEKKDLVERRRLGNDRRSYRIYLTENGREMSRRVTEAFREMEIESLPEVTDKEKQDFLRALDEIYLQLKSMLKNE